MTRYTWDHRNRLARVEQFADYAHWQAADPDWRVEYAYDAFDRRIVRRADADGDGQFDTQRFDVYDGAHVVLRLDDQGRPSRRMLYGPAVDQVLAEERLDYDAESGELVSDSVLWPLADHLGSIRDVAVLNDHGTPGDPGDDTTDIVNHLVYDSFGRITSQTDSGKEPFHTFTGRGLHRR